jgi:hypothetical protein
MHWKYAEQLAWQTIDGEAVIVALATGRSISLNATGSLIWQHLPTHSEEEIAQLLAEKYQRTVSDTRDDVSEFVRTLAERQLLCPAGAR